MRTTEIDIVEDLVKSLVKTTSLRTVFVGIHNAFAHGEAMIDADLQFTDEDLSEMFKSFENLIVIAQKIETDNGY